MRVDLHTPLSVRSAFVYPLQSDLARRELLWGAVLLLIPGLGWLLNMGHRIQMVHHMHHGQEAWPAWRDYPLLVRNGAITFLGMLYYASPGLLALAVARQFGLAWLQVPAALLLLAAVIAIPGYMTHYCRDFDRREVFDPARAVRRVLEGGRAYWKAWGIALVALALSFLGLLAFGVGFLATSVWFWQVAGFSFACVFTPQLEEARAAPG
jgi:hypothetical protein